MRFDAINPGPRVTSEEIDAYAAEHGFDVPVELRSRLLEQNGGAPRSEHLVRLADGGVEVLNSFFGLGMSDPSAELAWIVQAFRGRVPEGMLPFADDPGGNLYVLSSEGAVWFWDHELEGRPEALTQVSESFDGFIHTLGVDSE